MIFINPKTDFGFKKIFGTEENEDILISFLNGVLYDGNNTIKDLDILNPYQAPRIRGVKATYLDIKARLDDGTVVIIEMQVLNVEGFEKRILYNAAKAYSIQLGTGQAYSSLNPVIALTITDFVMFPEHNAIMSRFVLKEKEFLFDYPVYDLELVFVELPKFNRAVDDLVGLTDKWMYFLCNARQLRTVPAILARESSIQRAFEVANQANFTLEELDEQEHEEFFIQDQRGAIIKAAKQGMQQGLQQGIQQGIQQGSQQAQADIARRLLSVMDDSSISAVTGLPVETVFTLRQENSG